jgi:hypothetical protein
VIFYAHGHQHTTAFPSELKAVWSGTARDLFGARGKQMYKLILADLAGKAIK